jgi:hypothetical protein
VANALRYTSGNLLKDAFLSADFDDHAALHKVTCILGLAVAETSSNGQGTIDRYLACASRLDLYVQVLRGARGVHTIATTAARPRSEPHAAALPNHAHAGGMKPSANRRTKGCARAGRQPGLPFRPTDI